MGVTQLSWLLRSKLLNSSYLQGTLLLPLFLLSGTLIAPFATELALKVDFKKVWAKLNWSLTQLLKDQLKNYLVGQSVMLQQVLSKQSLVQQSSLYSM